jgi:hypothetical protein
MRCVILTFYLFIYLLRQCAYKVTWGALSRNHCCSGKTKSITHFYAHVDVSALSRVSASARARVPLLNKHAKRKRLIVICGLSGSTIFFDIIS